MLLRRRTSVTHKEWLKLLLNMFMVVCLLLVFGFALCLRRVRLFLEFWYSMFWLLLNEAGCGNPIYGSASFAA